MKKIGLALLVLTLASPLAANVWKGVALMDTNCSGEAALLEHPENHKKSCAIKCQKGGYGAVIDGKYVKFDKKGNKLAASVLKQTKKNDHLTVTVDGELKGDEIAVKSLKLD
jgi:hypothetical protein